MEAKPSDEKLVTVCAHCGGANRLGRDQLDAALDHARCGRCKAPLLSREPQAVSEANFGAFVSGADIPVLVDFWAPWCGPCRQIAPILEKVAARLAPNVRVVKINIDEAQGLAQKLRVQSIPTLAVYQRGKELARTAGAMPEQALTDWIRQATGQG